MSEQVPDYGYSDSTRSHAHAYLLPIVDAILSGMEPKPRRIFDLGCGNGSFAYHLSQTYDVQGVDASESGIEQARRSFPNLKLVVGSAYDDLSATHGKFDVVVSLEVIEHLYAPRKFAQRAFELVRPGGGFVISTPYHGYWKNLVLAATGKMDEHFTALWDGGHIKFWSINTLGQLFSEAGFVELEFHRVGRIPPFAKSMILVGRRP